MKPIDTFFKKRKAQKETETLAQRIINNKWRLIYAYLANPNAKPSSIVYFFQQVDYILKHFND